MPLFPVKFLRRCERAADVEGRKLQGRTGITENQSDEVVYDEDEAERQTEIKQSGNEQERYFHGSHDYLGSASCRGVIKSILVRSFMAASLVSP